MLCWFAFQRAACFAATVLARREMADSRVLATARHIHICLRVAVLRDSSHFRGFRSAGGGEASRAWHPREFGAVLGVSASLPLPAPPLPSSSRRYAPQCFVGGYTSSPCDVSHRASDELRRCMSLSSALAPSSLASPSIRRVFLRSFCARRRPVSSLNLAATHPPRFRPHHNLISPRFDFLILRFDGERADVV